MSLELILDIYPESEQNRFNFQLSKRNNDFSSHPYLLRGCKIIRGGIHYLCKQYTHTLSIEECQMEIEKHGKTFLRPYQLGQGWDGDCEPCIMALFYNACFAFGCDPLALYNAAYPMDDRDERLQQGDIEADIALAEWQGVHYPDQWNRSTIKELIKALEEINMRNLIVQLQKVLSQEEHHAVRSH